MQDLLLSVKKPARYIGTEFNGNHGLKQDVAVKFAICFPGLYEIGMSNLGLRIIYGLLNSQQDCLCERFFLPAPDMLGLIKSKKAKFTSLESGRSLSDFDIVGFSLQHELDYTNVLHMLELAGLPFFSRQRHENHPLIIAGGPALANPEPIADFFDLFIIGEAEEALLELTAEYKKFPSRLNRKELLARLSKIDGIYVPMLKGRVGFSVRRRFIKDLNSSFFPQDWIVPYIPIVHDKIMLEVMRGCPHSCRFCQARMFYSPFRIKSKERIVQLGLAAQEKSGYEEISLLGLSSLDHPQIKEIYSCLTDALRSQCVGVSLGSLRPSSRVLNLLEMTAKIKKVGLTLAIESGSNWLRQLINKQIDMDSLKELIQACYSKGLRRIKLYFMFGLPFEREDDLESIADIIYELAHIGGRLRKNLLFSVSINPFIPKPHTVFQWHPMDDLKTLDRKKRFLISAIYKRIKNVKISFHSPGMSYVEALLARGDRKMSGLIIEAFKRGALMDSYGDYFNFDLWQEAEKAAGIDAGSYLYRETIDEQKLCWDYIDMGYDKERLKIEYEDVIKLGRMRPGQGS